MIVKGKENGGFGPPPGRGFVTLTVIAAGAVSRKDGMGTSKTVPPAEATPPVSGRRGKLLRMTEVPFTKFDPVKCSVTGVPTVVLGGVIDTAFKIGFMTVKGRVLLSAPAGSVIETW